MDIVQDIRQKAAQKRKKIVLPRSSDLRVQEAASFLLENELCDIVLIDNGEPVPSSLEHKLIEPKESAELESYANAFYEKRKHKGVSYEQALEIVQNPLFFGASMVAEGDADSCVAGSISTTGDVLRAAIQTIGLKPGSTVVSSIFLMALKDGRIFSYGDCAVVPYPTSEQLASIAIDSANSHKAVTGEEPNVAMLSFSTKGSADHERVSLVSDAFELAKAQQSGINIDGELQFDAALLEEIGAKKAPGSLVAGKANVFIFPNLDAGNIAYKITERLAGASAIGPLIQGLNKPMMDLSRGCSWEDIVNTSCLAALMS